VIEKQRLAPAAGGVATAIVIVLGWWLFERGAALHQDRKVVVLLTGVLVTIAMPALVAMRRRPLDRHPRRWLIAALCFTVGYFRLVEDPWAATLGAAVWFGTPAFIATWMTDRDDRGRVRTWWVSIARLAPLFLSVGLVLCSGPATRTDNHRFRAISWVHYRESADQFVAQANPLALWPSARIVTALTIVWWGCIVVVALWIVTERGRNIVSRCMLLVAAAATMVLAKPDDVVTFTQRRAGRLQAPSVLLGAWLDPLLAVPALACACLGGVLVWRELVLPRLSRTVGGSLKLADHTSPEALRADLVRTLGDPTVRVAFQSDDGWIDERGRPVVLGVDDRRGVTVIRRDGVDIAALDHDLSLMAQPDLVQVAATSLAMSLEAQRLAAVAEAASADVRESAARLLAAAESGRLDVERRIMSGPDRTLATVDELLDARPLDLTAIHDGLRAALTDVRTIARGAIPASLEGEGLRAALDDLRVATDVGIDVRGLDDTPRPYVVDATLFRVVADCAHSASDRIAVTIDGTNGEVHMRVVAPLGRLTDLTVDRIEGLGGRVHISDDNTIATVDVSVPLQER